MSPFDWSLGNRFYRVEPTIDDNLSQITLNLAHNGVGFVYSPRWYR